jgi:ABC-type branched-subunit amino acid transport system ATPase component
VKEYPDGRRELLFYDLSDEHRVRDAACSALGVAGPNGAGKSTLDRYMAGRLPVINPYNIARELDPGLGEGQRVLRAGRLAVAERDQIAGGGQALPSKRR